MYSWRLQGQTSLRGSRVWASLHERGEATDKADSSVKTVKFCGQPFSIGHGFTLSVEACSFYDM